MNEGMLFVIIMIVWVMLGELNRCENYGDEYDMHDEDYFDEETGEMK